MPWPTRLRLTEGKLAQVKNELRCDPHNESLRAECEKLEKMYAGVHRFSAPFLSRSLRQWLVTYFLARV